MAEEDLERLLSIVARNRESLNVRPPLPWPQRTERNRRRSQRDQISRHYDIGNDYYRLFLDPTLTYSCAYFEDPADSLEQAQQRKIEHVLRKLRLEPGQRLLDIGCGWGSLVVAAAERYGVTALGITLSHEQLAGALELAERHGVADRVRFALMNYQDLPVRRAADPLLRGPFDRVASVGMFEHVGRGRHSTYFRKVHDLLIDGGVSVLHTITNQQRENTEVWLDRYIFPGGHLPTLAEIESALARHRLWSIDRENLWRHYARTLGRWRQNHRSHREQIISMFGEEFYRMRDLWLAASKCGFEDGGLGLAQLVFTKGKPRDWPLTRRYLYAET
nr:cyclopropane-fatty-acyl-phospholipid synthase family protein [Pseudonocardia acidicola]